MSDDARREIGARTRSHLLYILERLRRGYTGEFHLTCNQGGIQRVRQSHDVDLDGVDESTLARGDDLG